MAAARGTSDFDRGRRIGKYEILTRLSMGGMAELYLAFLPGPGGFKKFVALKQILPDVKRDDAFVRMFLDEARITAAFTHANIGQVFDLGEDPESGELYLAMEFIAGQNLEQVLKRAAKKEVAIPAGFAARVIRDASLALHYAHHFTEASTGMAMPVVHRDVSPKNVMITYTGDVKVIDFGIAKARGRLNRTQVGIVKGTSGYMAPEQVRNEPLDGRTDLFAAAVMLHEMLCGERLFTAPTDAAMMLKIVEGEVVAPAEVNQFVSPAFSAVVLRGLEKQRDKRFSTGKEFARAIEQSCDELFEEEQLAEVMKQLFDDKIALTRSILELANEEKDPNSLSRAVEGLTQEEQDQVSGGRKKATNSPGEQEGLATPSPRPSVGGRSGGSSQRLPKVSARSSQRLPAVEAPRSRSSQRLPKVDSKKELEPVEASAPRRSSRSKLNQVPDEAPAPRRTSNPRVDPVPEPEEGGSGGLTVVVIVLAIVVLGGAGWAFTKGPLADVFTSNDEVIPVDTGPTRIDLTAPAAGKKPAWLVEKEAQEAREAEEKARQKEIEEAANDPERLALLQEITAQIDQLDRLEAEQRQLKVDARQGKENTAQNSKRIDDLQSQINQLKDALKVKQARKRSAAPASDPETVEVVRDVASAKAADLGYLTIYTLNPSSASVSVDGESMGSSPVVKVPLEAGSHRLTLIDGDSKPHSMSITIAPGKTEVLRLDVSTMPQ